MHSGTRLTYDRFGHFSEPSPTCLFRARQLFVKVGCDDEQMLAHIEELLGEYQAKGLYTPGEGQEADAEADWVDQDEDDEMEMD
jgi:hypothetical protein